MTAAEQALWSAWSARMAEAKHFKRRADHWRDAGRLEDAERCERERQRASEEARRARARATAVRKLVGWEAVP